MNKNTSMAAVTALAGILALAVMTVAIPHHAFAGSSNSCCDNNNNKPCCDNNDKKVCCDNNDKKQSSTEVATGGNGGSGGAGGAGGEGGAGGANVVSTSMKGSYQDTSLVSASSSGNVTQKANGGDANGGYGGNANGGDART